MFLLWTFLGAIIANVLYVYISFDESIRLNAWKIYSIGSFASVVGGISWIYMVRHLSGYKQIFLANFGWDITVTILCTLLPIIMYGIKIDYKTTLGCILAISGIVLIHFGEIK